MERIVNGVSSRHQLTAWGLPDVVQQNARLVSGMQGIYDAASKA